MHRRGQLVEERLRQRAPRLLGVPVLRDHDSALHLKRRVDRACPQCKYRTVERTRETIVAATTERWGPGPHPPEVRESATTRMTRWSSTPRGRSVVAVATLAAAVAGRAAAVGGGGGGSFGGRLGRRGCEWPLLTNGVRQMSAPSARGVNDRRRERHEVAERQRAGFRERDRPSATVGSAQRDNQVTGDRCEPNGSSTSNRALRLQARRSRQRRRRRRRERRSAKMKCAGYRPRRRYSTRKASAKNGRRTNIAFDRFSMKLRVNFAGSRATRPNRFRSGRAVGVVVRGRCRHWRRPAASEALRRRRCAAASLPVPKSKRTALDRRDEGVGLRSRPRSPSGRGGAARRTVRGAGEVFVGEESPAGGNSAPSVADEIPIPMQQLAAASCASSPAADRAPSPSARTPRSTCPSAPRRS